MFGIRPEDLAQSATPAPTRSPPRSTAVEPLGAETIATLRDRRHRARDRRARLGRDADVRVADRLHLRPDLARARLFDAASGIALG